MAAPTVRLADLDAAAEASGMPDVWAEVVAVANDVARLESDLARVRRDVDRLPRSPCGTAFARRWYASVQRREQELVNLRRHLDRLRRDVGASFVDAAASHAPASRGAWVVVPGGSDHDG